MLKRLTQGFSFMIHFVKGSHGSPDSSMEAISSSPPSVKYKLDIIAHASSCRWGFQSTTETFGMDCSLDTTDFRARVTGGCGFTTLSCQRTPIFSGCWWDI